MTINIAGQVHNIEQSGVTSCGKRYPTSWRTSRRDVTCPACLRLGETRLEAVRAEARRYMETAAGENLPW